MDYVIVSYDENTGDVVQDTLVTPPEPLKPIQPPQCSRLQPCDIIEDYGKIGFARIEKPAHVDGMTEYIDIYDALDIPRPARIIEAPADEEPLSDSSTSSDSSDSDLGLRMHTADYLSSKHQPIATLSPVARHPPLDCIRIDVIKKIMSDALLAKSRHVRHYHKRSNDTGVDMFRHPKP
jgi:hypothetical protein